MKMIKSPLSKCDLSAGEPGETDFMKHGLVQIMLDSNPNSSLKREKLIGIRLKSNQNRRFHYSSVSFLRRFVTVKMDWPILSSFL